MNLTLNVTLPSSGTLVILEVEAYPDEIEVYDGLTQEEVDALPSEDWKAIEDAAHALMATRVGSDDEDDILDWWDEDQEPEIMGLDEADRGW